ncbi:hypothetical protein GGR56DRAFT_630930 [Xylariaceae sp. FL0804]|nr:hypothetical protein GGR56DRAFT_630930 [Xylariaceae sp. FL0804]
MERDDNGDGSYYYNYDNEHNANRDNNTGNDDNAAALDQLLSSSDAAVPVWWRRRGGGRGTLYAAASAALGAGYALWLAALALLLLGHFLSSAPGGGGGGGRRRDTEWETVVPAVCGEVVVDGGPGRCGWGCLESTAMTMPPPPPSAGGGGFVPLDDVVTSWAEVVQVPLLPASGGSEMRQLVRAAAARGGEMTMPWAEVQVPLVPVSGEMQLMRASEVEPDVMMMQQQPLRPVYRHTVDGEQVLIGYRRLA